MSDWRERLEELADQEDGWLDGYGKAMTAGAYDTATDMLDRIERNGLRVYPTPEGGVQIVLGYWPYEIEVMVKPDGSWEVGES